MYLRAGIEFRSVKPVLVKPTIFTAGSFTLKTKDGKEIIFDFNFLEYRIDMDLDGNIQAIAWLKDFDEEYFEESNEGNGITLEQVMNPKFLTECTLSEIFYECYVDGDEDTLIPMTIIQFDLYGSEGQASFSEEQLKEYDKIAVWRD